MRLKLVHRIHRVAGPAALLAISGLWLSTLASTLSTLWAGTAWIAFEKRALLAGVAVLVVALAVAALTGLRLAAVFRPSRELSAKRRRMPLIAGVGLVVLLPPRSHWMPSPSGPGTALSWLPCRASNWPPER